MALDISHETGANAAASARRVREPRTFGGITRRFRGINPAQYGRGFGLARGKFPI